ncbi:MAG: type II toxin-antitoxin system Phd/YefM family antitoxin [Rectinemataceae bacterium]
MEITAKELRGKPGQIIEQAAKGIDIVITIRGKKMARLIPYKTNSIAGIENGDDDELFGLWTDKDDGQSVEEYVRERRKRRSLW